MAESPSRRPLWAGLWFALGLLCGGLGWAANPPAVATQRMNADETGVVATIKRVSPAVVSILTVSIAPDDLSFDPVPKRGAGSGVVIDRAGHILTNFHVIGGAQRMEVIFGDIPRRIPATLVGQDPLTDLAIIRVTTVPSAMVPAKLGDSADLQVGQQAIAIGNPFGLGRTVTTGVVSAIRDIRNDDGRVMRRMIQTDAAINQGNSGGPLLNSQGEIIGINTMIFSPSGGSVGIGFAIPVDQAKRLIPDLINKGKVIRPWLGLDAFPLSAQVAAVLRLPVRSGILVSRLSPKGSLALAGLRGGGQRVAIEGRYVQLGGDVIIAVDGQAVRDIESLSTAIDRHRVGDTVAITLVRAGRTLAAKVRLVGPP